LSAAGKARVVLRARVRVWLAVLAAAGAPACGKTVDSLGGDGTLDGGSSIVDSGSTFDGPTGDGSGAYPNPFHSVLGKTQTEIDAKVEGAFQQLFHGDPGQQAIYFPVGTDQAYVEDIRFTTVWAESMGYGMFIAVELDKKDEFDRLWTWTKSFMQFATGPTAGTFRDSCATDGTSCAKFPDSYGSSYIATALLFAGRHWGNGSGVFDYELEAQRVINAMPIFFDSNQALAVIGPVAPTSLHASPADQLPSFTDIWADETVNGFWHMAAQSARSFWKISSDPTTGLAPGSADFSGVPVSGFDTFSVFSYGLGWNIAADHLWFGVDAWQVSEADKLVAFFTRQGVSTYVDSYSLDGSPMGNAHPTALVSTNGAIAGIATTSDRVPFIQAVWDVAIPTGSGRYDDGVFYMLSLLALSGKLRMF
jgi:oligosaccharide reducing-end xylanase